MKILCLIKLVPDIDNLRYDRDRNVLIRDSAQMMINPEDASAVAASLAVKGKFPGTEIEVVSMAPQGVLPHLEDLIRRGVDRATLIADPRYVGSDTWATSTVLARYLGKQDFDCIFCGTHTLDGGTAQVPAQVAELLGLPYMGNVSSLDETSFPSGRVAVEVDGDSLDYYFQVKLPAILGFQFAPKRRLPFITFENLSKDVSDQVVVIGNNELALDESAVGLKGSLTQVTSLQASELGLKDAVVVKGDAQGIQTVFRFLESKGFLRS